MEINGLIFLKKKLKQTLMLIQSQELGFKIKDGSSNIY